MMCCRVQRCPDQQIFRLIFFYPMASLWTSLASELTTNMLDIWEHAGGSWSQ